MATAKTKCEPSIKAVTNKFFDCQFLRAEKKKSSTAHKGVKVVVEIPTS